MPLSWLVRLPTLVVHHHALSIVVETHREQQKPEGEKSEMAERPRSHNILDNCKSGEVETALMIAVTTIGAPRVTVGGLWGQIYL
jgi:hypothetical protein